MNDTDSAAPAGANLLRLCLIVIAATYAAFGLTLVLTGVSAPLTVVGRVLIVSLLCLQVSRGHNWARLLLGVFTVLIAVLAVLSAGMSSGQTARGLPLVGLPLLLGIAYLTLVLHPIARAQFNAARARRSGNAAL